MSKFIQYTFLLIAGFGFLISPNYVKAADVWCFCAPSLDGVSAEKLNKDDKGIYHSSCELLSNSTYEMCAKKTNSATGVECSGKSTETECKNFKTEWDKKKSSLSGATAAADFESTYGANNGLSKIIPNCVLGDPSKNSVEDEKCRDVSIFVIFLINIARYLFSIVGGLALAMFIYGGFTLILSQGSSDKVKKGTEIITASVIGLIIMFGAYMLVQYLGEAIKLKSDFTIK